MENDEFTFVTHETTNLGYGTRTEDLARLGPAIDIVFIGSGYWEEHMTEYETAVRHIANKLFATVPFDRYEHFFRVKWVQLVTPKFADASPLGVGKYDGNEALGNQSDTPVMLVNFEKVKAVLGHDAIGLDGPGQADVVVILVNAAPSYFGRAIGINGNIMNAMPVESCSVPELLTDMENRGFPVGRTENDGPDFGFATGIAITYGIKEIVHGVVTDFADIAIHEFAHAFVGLGDEYFEYPSGPLAGKLSYENQHLIPNLLRLREEALNFDSPLPFGVLKGGFLPDALKWEHWIDDETEVPSTPGDENKVGLFLGGGYMQIDSSFDPPEATFRPAYECKMKEVRFSFCPVCQEAIIGAIYTHLDPLPLIAGRVHENKQETLYAPGQLTLPQVSPSLLGFIKYEWSYAPPEDSYPPLSATSPLVLAVNKGGAFIEDFYYRFRPDWTECYVQVTVRDDTPWVRDSNPDVRERMEQSTSWLVHVEFAPVLADSPWPVFQHDNQRTGRCQQTGPFNPFVEWTVSDISDFPGPVIGEDGTLYIAGKERGLLALDRDTGNTVWQSQRTSMSSALAAMNGIVCVGSMEGHLIALEAGSGEGVAEIQIEDPPAERIKGVLAIGKGGTVYLPYNGHLCATYKTEDGRLESRWDCSYGSDNARPVPALSEQGIIYLVGTGTGPKNLIGYLWARYPDGTEYWEEKELELGEFGTRDIGASGTMMGPVVGEDGLIYVSMDRVLFAVQPDREIKWRLTLEDEISAHPVIAGSGVVYAPAGNKVRALNSHSGSQIWVCHLPDGAKVTCMALDGNGTLYAASRDRYLYGIVAGGQRMTWQIPSNTGPTSIAIGSRETVYVTAGSQLLAITEALEVEGIGCDILVIDSSGRACGAGDTNDRHPYVRPLPGAMYETDNTGSQFMSRATIPHPITGSFYSAIVTPRPEADTYGLWVVEGTNRYPLAEGVHSDDLPDEPYSFRYPQSSPPTDIIQIGVRPGDLPVFNGRVIMAAGTSGDFTAIGIDGLGQEWDIAARWRVTPSVGRLITVKRAQTRIKVSRKVGARGLVMIRYKKMTAKIPVRIVSSRRWPTS